MNKKYTAKAQEALKHAEDAASELGHGSVGSEHLLIGLLRTQDCLAQEIMKKEGIQAEDLLGLTGQMMGGDDLLLLDRGKYTPRAQRALNTAQGEAVRFHSESVGTEHILIALLKEKDSVAVRFLNTLGADARKLYTDTIQAMGFDAAAAAREDFSGFSSDGETDTPTLDKYSRDLTGMALDGVLDPVIGRDSEIERVIQILNRRTKNNPCLIGDPGVGKTAIVEGIAQRIVNGSVPETLLGKRLVTLDLSGMVAGSKYRGEFEERIRNVIHEVISSGNVLLFLDEIHTLIGAGNAEGAIDASNILKPSLARGELQLIGATTTDEYRKHIEKDAALERRFQPVTVEEPTEAEAIDILYGIREMYEKYHDVTISDSAVEAAVKLSRRYISDRFLPDKAIDLIDEASSKARLKASEGSEDITGIRTRLIELESEKEKALISKKLDVAGDIRSEQKKLKIKLEQLLEKQDKKRASSGIVIDDEAIADVVSMWTKIPLSRLTETETGRLLKLEEELHKRVVGQDEAVTAISKAIRRGRVGLGDPNRPIGSFMFLGPTGVGKTELSKALAAAMFGSEDALIRVDMSEYMEKFTVSRMIGSPPGYVGYEEGGQLSEKVRRNPYSVVLFDEIEKAHPDIFNVLLQVLDDGQITDSEGRRIDFKNTIIIMTSNIGARSILEPKTLGFVSEYGENDIYKDMKSNVMEDVGREFRPEFINRIDEIIVFRQLTKEQIGQIVDILIKKLNDRINTSKNVTVTLTASGKKYITEHGYDVKYGARPLRRTIQREIEDVLAEKILNGEILPGSRVNISAKNDKLEFKIAGKKESAVKNNKKNIKNKNK